MLYTHRNPITNQLVVNPVLISYIFNSFPDIESQIQKMFDFANSDKFKEVIGSKSELDEPDFIELLGEFEDIHEESFESCNMILEDRLKSLFDSFLQEPLPEDFTLGDTAKYSEEAISYFKRLLLLEKQLLFTRNLAMVFSEAIEDVIARYPKYVIEKSGHEFPKKTKVQITPDEGFSLYEPMDAKHILGLNEDQG